MTATNDVIILGAGPAGLAAAAELKRLGVRDVLVIEREQQAGGVPRHCGHLGFGWKEFRRVLTGPSYAKRLSHAAAGVEVRTGTTALALEPGGRIRVVSPEGQETLTGKRILLALGTRETPRSTRLVSGTRPWGVFTTGALQQLVYLARIQPCRRAVIVGTEFVSFSSLLTMRHAGIKPVAMIESGERILAPAPGAWIARIAFATRVLTRTQVVAIHGARSVTGIEIERAGERSIIACDGVVFTGRFVPETAIVRSSHLALDAGTGGPVVDQYGRCSDPDFFAAGNLLRPVEPSWTVWSEGRAVAHAIAASLHDALPAATRLIPLEAHGPVRYVCPQRAATPAPLPAALPFNARVARPANGRLRVLAGKRELWGQDRRFLPERRLYLPLDTQHLGSVESLAVDLAEPARP
ncbi:MAG: NAD(P)/FAD-dependent oxidoreductase [Burkholderiales bacterium]|nr:NAD(P)/FAD-dependent oxidoreductase [Burkholderiales bacterium]